MTDPTTQTEWEVLDRPHNEALDAILGVPSPVLDHGFVRVIDYMGDEAAVCQAARVSYGKGTKSLSDDVGLLRYLMRHRHTTPYEMCELKLHVKLPVFVARQWVRHRTANVNEYSARYSILNGEFYIPEPEQIMPQSGSNKQGKEGELPEDVRQSMRTAIEAHSENSYGLYKGLLTGWPWFDEDGARREDSLALTPTDQHENDHGMAREMARMVCPPNIYTEWYWKVNLHNLLHFLSLRADPHAQYEIREYADVICNIVEEWVPNIWKAFVDYRLTAHTFSGPEMEALRDYIAEMTFFGKDMHPPALVMSEGSKREQQEFRKALSRPS